MAHRIRVLLLIPHLGGGGAEQVAALLARGLSREKYDLHLGVVTGALRASIAQSAVPPGGIPAGIAMHALDAPRVRSGAVKLLRLVRRVRPDIILSGMFHLNFLVVLLKPFFPRGTRILLRQNGTLSADLASGDLPPGTRFLYRSLYRRADCVICASRAMADDLISTIGLPSHLAAMLPNPLDLEAIVAARQHPAPWPGPGPHLLAMGRLVPEKGFDLLLDAFAALQAQLPAAGLVIAGAGPEARALKAQCGRLGIAHAVRFPGHVENPYAFFPGATLFVLSSRREGMPNALLEALAGGLPVVAFPASGGVVEMLRDRPGAWLAPEISAAALAGTLLSALEALRSQRQDPQGGHNATLRLEPDSWQEGLVTAPPSQPPSSSAIAAYEALIDRIFAERLQ
jgi:glycosyltransferase involved in cell wall biosynthesis